MSLRFFFIGMVFLISCQEKKIVSEIWIGPGDSLQETVDRAAEMDPKPVVRLRSGLYQPSRPAQALLYLNRRHDGLEIRGEAGTVLTAANEKIADPAAYSYPAVVNHVLYLGDGLTSKTRIANLTITGAKGFVSRADDQVIEPNSSLWRRFIFYADGGGIKIFGNSYPVLEYLKIEHNSALICGGGISIEQMGMAKGAVQIRNVQFLFNRAPLTGAALDLLPGSHALVDDSHFEGNQANNNWLPWNKLKEVWETISGSKIGLKLDIFFNSSAVTVFPGSSIVLRNSTFKSNSGGIDFNPHVNWYWRQDPKGKVLPLVKSHLEDVSFINDTLHGVKTQEPELVEMVRIKTERTEILTQKPSDQTSPQGKRKQNK